MMFPTAANPAAMSAKNFKNDKIKQYTTSKEAKF